MRRNRTANAVVLGLFVSLGTKAEDVQHTDNRALPAAFLEFLGDWEDERGDWQDPLEFSGSEWPPLTDDAEQHYETD